ncbi:uncharacterized protein LOC142344478 isoform X3 [Convolutriloba macropyga]|uniref:uncharacterized protein LOC142344478 isoform X3 n=1 Tax=Convolutriloba macropyga TaxID=536237 RepID=UPI003F521ED2
MEVTLKDFVIFSLCSLKFAEILSSEKCLNLRSITRCQLDLLKIPLASYTVTSHPSLTEENCLGRMQTFKWAIGLFCPSSHFCGMGVNFDSKYDSEQSQEFTPLNEVCHVLVNTEFTTCEETKATLFSVGILRKSAWSCLSHGYIYCADKYLTKCLDVEGGAICTGCVEGAQPIKEGKDNHCIDIDECQMSGEPVCGESSTCMNEYLSYRCNCTQGFQSNSSNSNQCIDIDECTELSNICSEKGKCVNNENGGYACNCDSGYLFNENDYGSGCREWFFFWDHVLTFSSQSSVTLADLININQSNLKSANEDFTFIHDSFYDMIAGARLIVLAVFDQSDVSPVSVVMFRGTNHPFTWFSSQNIISSSLWKISPYLSDMIMQFDGFGFEIAQHSDLGVKAFLKISCSAAKQCDLKYSSSKDSKNFENLDNGSRIEIYAQPQKWWESRDQIQLLFSDESDIEDFESFFAGEQKESYNSKNTFRALDFDRQIQNAAEITIKLYRRVESGYNVLVFKLQNATFTHNNWFTREHLSTFSYFNFSTHDPQFTYKDLTGGILSISKNDNNSEDPCAQEIFLFKITCRNTNSDCGFDWSKTSSNCVILLSRSGTSWAKKNYRRFKRIEILTESMTEAFSFTYPQNIYSNMDILNLYDNGHLQRNDLDTKIAFRHYRMENLFTECYYVKFRLYNSVQNGEWFYHNYTHQEFVFKCGKDHFDWFTASKLIKVSFIDELSGRDLLVNIVNEHWPQYRFIIWDQALIDLLDTADVDDDDDCISGTIAGRSYSNEIQGPSYESYHLYCGEFQGLWFWNIASKLEIIAYSTNALVRSKKNKWTLVFMVEAFSGIHIYNFYKTGSTDPAVPGLSIVQFGGHFFRHPDLESRILGSTYIRFSVYSLDKKYVVNDIIFKRESGDGFEDWFDWGNVYETSMWDFSDRVSNDDGNLFLINLAANGATGPQESHDHVNQFYEGSI